MSSKIITALAFTLIIVLLGLIASDFSEGQMAGLSIRNLLAIILVMVASLYGRFWRAQKDQVASALHSSPGKAAEDYARLKPLYLTLAVVTAASYFFMPSPGNWLRCSGMVAACLLAVFFTPERVEDERVEQLKMKATRAAFAAGFFIVFLHTWALGTKERTSHFLSAFDMIIITMLIALGLFHYWRWQDGRAERVK